MGRVEILGEDLEHVLGQGEQLGVRHPDRAS
jgi:hypothetical protein